MKAKLLLFITLFSVLVVQGQEINFKQGSTSYASGATYSYVDTQVNGTTSITFTVENLSAPNLLISGATPRVEITGVNADQFVISGVLNASISNGSSDTFIIQFKPTSIGTKSAVMTILSNDADESTYIINLTATSIVSKTSTISLPSSPSYTYTSTIPYMSYQSADIDSPAAGFEIITFRINDASNSENLPTTLTDLTLSISNSANIRRVALYDGTTELDEVDGASSVVFNGLSITAPAGSTKTFQVLVTFNEIVTDNHNISIGITSATADPSGSNFAATNAGGATSTTSSSFNKIVVIATTFNFFEAPSNSDTFIPMDPAVKVEAIDALGNRDLNYTSAITLNTTGTFHTTGTTPLNIATVNAVAGLATFSQIVYETVQTNVIIYPTSGALIPVNSEFFNIEPASGAGNYFRTKASGNWNSLSSWESSGNNITWTDATLIPTSVSKSIDILAGHSITCNSTEEADQMTIRATGSLKITTGGSLNIKNGSGTDVTAYGTLEYAGGTFTQAASATMTIGATTGMYIHSIPSATLSLPKFSWSTNSTCSITGLNNSSPITATNMNQNFQKFIWDNPNQLAIVNIDDNAFKVIRTLTVGSSANNNLCISSTGTHTNSIAAVTITGGTLTGFSGTSDGTLTMSTLTITNGTFIGNNSSGTTAINNTSTITLNANGHYIASNNTGTVTAIVNNINLNSNGKITLINNANSGNVTFNFASTNRSLVLKDTSNLLLENVSSASGVAVINISSAFTCSSTATPAVDFGTGNATGNTINLKGNFVKSGTGLITTSSATNASTGFVFNGATQTFNFSGTASSGVNYTANSSTAFNFTNSFTFATSPSTQKTIFTINAPSVSLGAYTFTGNATKAQFNIAAGVNVITTHSAGLGGTSATGNFVSFTSIGNTAADGRVVFGANSNYTFSGSTITPFPIGGTWATPNNVIVNNNITSNYTTPFNLNGNLTINTTRTFKLNASAGAHLNLKGTLTVNGTFDTNGQNEISNAGGTPSLVVNGTFITRDDDGFTGLNASVPNIPITMGSDGIVNYAGANQIITNYDSYRNVTLSGTGVKTLGASLITVGNELNVTGTTLLSITADKTMSVADKISTISTTSTRGIIIENNGSLVQINTVDNETTNENSGNIFVKRIAKPMFKTDYTYWSSPITTSAAFTLATLSPLTMSNKYMKYNYAATTQAWQVILNGTEVMVPGRGYLVRAPNTYPASGTPTSYAATFSGVPNNGTVSHPISGSATTDRWNLLGNPYPSAMDARSFVIENEDILDGTLYFWTHNSAYGSSSGYEYSSADYATWNFTGSVAASIDLESPDGKIASGQGFFIKGIADGSAVFNNVMRVNGNNNQFFKQNNVEVETESNRVWLNMKGETAGFSQMLVGYVSNATNGLDGRYDGQSFGGNQVSFYSLIDTKKLVIQGRALPFATQDLLPLGYNSTLATNLTISIDHLDGLFTDQDVYLQDNLLNVVHNLKTANYTFATAIGTFDNRFVLRFTPQENLSNPTFNEQLKGVIIYKTDNNINIKSQYETIDQVYVYDLTGRLIFENKNTNTNSFEIKEMNTAQQALIVKIILKNGGISTKKVL